MIYDFFRWVAIISAYPLQWLFFKRKTFYEDKSAQSLRIKGGALVISNHFGAWDFVLNLFAVLPRKLHIVSSEHPYRNRFLAFGMRFWGGIQADRTTKSMRFIDDSVALLEQGGLVQIFPEGRNTPDGEVGEFRLTYLMIASRAGVPIIPIVTDGQYGFFKRTHILVGRAIDLSLLCPSAHPNREELMAANEVIHAKIVEMKAELGRLSAKN